MFGLYRFILSLLVALSHFGFTFCGFNPGQWAVVCFYVLSGLLMERQFKKLVIVGGTFAFYTDRFLRIFPLYIIVVILCVITTPVRRNDLLANITLLPLNYAVLTKTSMYLGSAWSLSCEFHFYLLVPLVVFLSTYVLRWILAASLTVFAISPFLPNSAFWAYVGLPGTLFTFLSGILINRQDWGSLRIFYSIVAILGVGFLFSKVAGMELPTGIHCNVCIGYLVAVPTTLLLARLSPKILWDRFLGLFSYPLFLVHTLVGTLCLIYIPTVGMATVMGLSLLATACLIILVELPFDYIRYKIRNTKSFLTQVNSGLILLLTESWWHRRLTSSSEATMIHEREKNSFDWLALWILFSAWSSLSGWCLSACGYLKPAGIAISYSLFFACLILFRSHLQGKGGRTGWKILRSCYLAPKIWLLLTVLVFVGGIAYSPNNYDYLTYRFPRILYWSWDHAWSWIPTVDHRMNYSATGFEWDMVPLFIIFKTDRLFFLINFISYLLLPGVIFSVFSSLGISKRISWWWMWILPCGYCYILQAASAGNDSFAALYFLASLHYLFQTKTSSAVKNLTFSCLAIALMTGAKASNLPLVLPWLIVLFFHRKYFLEKSRPVMLAMVLIAAAVSFLPMALLNIHFTGDYAGDPNNYTKMKVSNPVSGMLGNSLQLGRDNLAPPLLPRPIDWGPMVPSQLKAILDRDFPRLNLRMGELQIEEGAGLGLGIVLFVSLFIVMGMRARVAAPSLVVARNSQALWVVGAGVIAWLVYMSKMGSEATSRLIAAYYPLLVAGILVIASLDGRIVYRCIFKWISFIAMLSAIPLVILCPARPLFPVQLLSNIMIKSHVPSGIVARYNQVYSVYAARSDGLKELIVSIPPSERAIGLLQTGDDAEVSLWRPFGTRKVIEVTPKDSMEEVKARGLHFVAVNQDALVFRYHTTLAILEAKWSASLVVKKSIILMARVGPETWYLLRL